jgi:hypothetical protein
LRKIPLYKATEKEGDSHFLAYPARFTLKKALNSFLEQKKNFEKGTVWWTDIPVMLSYLRIGLRFHAYNLKVHLHLYRCMSEIYLKMTKNKSLNTPERHSFQFQGSINTVPCCILLDNGASGTVFLDKATHSEKEGIALT